MIYPGFLIIFISERTRTDFPHPDSPIIPITSLFLRSKLTPFTALSKPSSKKKKVFKFLIDNLIASSL